MPGYFIHVPKTLYTLDIDKLNPQVVTDILRRSAFLREVSENTSVFYEYQMQDGDTAEIIADKLYRSVDRAWIVLLFNKILNPFYEFPMNNFALENYIVNKYNQTIDQAKSTIHHYELEITRNYILNGIVVNRNVDTYIVNDKEVDYDTGELSNRSLPGTADTELSLSTETSSVFSDGGYVTNSTKTKAISNYTYEITENEKRRTIKLLDKSYVPRVEYEFKRLMEGR